MGVGIHMTRQCAPYVPSHVLEQVCRSLVLYHLDYCSVVWASATKTDLFYVARLELVFIRCRLAYHGSMLIRGWPQAQSHFLVTHWEHTPEFLIDFFCNTVHNHNTRKSGKGNIVQAHPRTNSLKRTVLYYRASKMLNDLPLDIPGEKGKISFKKRLKMHF